MEYIATSTPLISFEILPPLNPKLPLIVEACWVVDVGLTMNHGSSVSASSSKKFYLNFEEDTLSFVVKKFMVGGDSDQHLWL